MERVVFVDGPSAGVVVRLPSSETEWFMLSGSTWHRYEISYSVTGGHATYAPQPTLLSV